MGACNTPSPGLRRANGPFHTQARITDHAQIATRIWLMRVECPELAAHIRPGQFVMVRMPRATDPLLGRPFAVYDTWLDAAGQPAGIEVVYMEMGRATRQLPGLQVGESIGLWGPLGHPFPEPRTSTKRVFLVAGGIGQTPFLAHARELLGQKGYGGQPPKNRGVDVHFVYGARNQSFHAGVEHFATTGANIHLATDDGSAGFHGRVTDCLAKLIGPNPETEEIFGCGPEPMLEALAKFAQSHGLTCHVSLETPMACGLGICFSCVTKVKTSDGWDYKRVCVDGPVFDASQLVWSHGNP